MQYAVNWFNRALVPLALFVGWNANRLWIQLRSSCQQEKKLVVHGMGGHQCTN
jgi:hypothetical protein